MQIAFSVESKGLQERVVTPLNSTRVEPRKQWARYAHDGDVVLGCT